ncbi:MAG: D-hexose-6-phosphate mutarotase [Chthoniobacteraceae bacterium]
MDTQLEIPGVARLATGPCGLPRYEITTPLAEAHIYLLGAHVSHFVPARQAPVLFMSSQSQFQPGSPIRGGVPVIFPWFGPREGFRSHGFARIRSWAPESILQKPGGEVVLTLRLEPDDEARAEWPGSWVLRYRVTVGSALTMELEIENTGSEPLRAQEALHTYFLVQDVRNVSVSGLEGAEYHDALDQMRLKRQPAEAICFTAETDRDYINTTSACVIEDPGLHRRIVVEKSGSQSTVVWNPWIAKSKAMPDFGDNEWPHMVCVESGNVNENTLEIAPGALHLSRTLLRTEPI